MRKGYQSMQTCLDTAIHSAAWILCPADFAAPVIRRTLHLDSPTGGKIALSALGFYHLYVNGIRVNQEYFRPSNSIFCPRDPASWIYPLQDTFTYRCYYAVYDISPYLTSGENRLEIALGDGWYRQTERIAEGHMAFGNALGAVYAAVVTDTAGEHVLLSDGTESCYTGALLASQLFYGETYDARLEPEENRHWGKVTVTELPDTQLTPEDAPPDRVIRQIQPLLLSEEPGRKLYDAGENISGFVTLHTSAAAGTEVHIRFAENLHEGKLSFETTGSGYKGLSGKPQIMEDIFIGDGREHFFTPGFVWHAFRYFEILGEGEAAFVSVVHSDVPVTSGFTSSSPELNWLFDAYIRTQLDNMHGGVPSDCPHRERLGYTGDGQITAPAAMTMLDAKDFYRKWIRDIFDSQDQKSGHVNHTAPFAGGGGGPGGWGCAAILVPYHYYKAYGDASPAAEYYDRMQKWIDYLLSRSENGLVTREEEGGWCLGDWCTLEKTAIPVSYVNTCYLIRSLRCMEELAAVLKREEDIPGFRQHRIIAEEAVCQTWFDPLTGSFDDGIQGANAYAVWAGLGDDRTRQILSEKYRKLGHFDTGFLGTDILCEVLMDQGDADLLYTLLTSHDCGSFGYMMDRGATTIWESWKGGSHNHPMFGACARQLFTGILGIHQKQDSAGYTKLCISPKIPADMTFAEGYQTIPSGKIHVRWERQAQEVLFTITIPAGCTAAFQYGGKTAVLPEGESVFTVSG